MSGIPILIFLVTFAGGAMLAARLLPALAPGRVGGLAFFVVCGLAGAGLSVFGLDIYHLARQLHLNNPDTGLSNGDLITTGVRSAIFEGAELFAFGAAVYLLAPGADD
jgi:hypothetical protein